MRLYRQKQTIFMVICVLIISGSLAEEVGQQQNANASSSSSATKIEENIKPAAEQPIPKTVKKELKLAALETTPEPIEVPKNDEAIKTSKEQQAASQAAAAPPQAKPNIETVKTPDTVATSLNRTATNNPASSTNVTTDKKPPSSPTSASVSQQQQPAAASSSSDQFYHQEETILRSNEEISDSLKTGFYFFAALSLSSIVFIIFKIYRLRLSRAERKYGVQGDRSTQELTPLPIGIEDGHSDDEDQTVFEINRQNIRIL